MYDYDINGIGTRIRTLRRKYSMSQQQLAEQLQVTRSCIANWESGAREIDVMYLYRISRFFNVDLEYIFGQISKNNNIKNIDTSILNHEGRLRLERYYSFLISDRKFLK